MGELKPCPFCGGEACLDKSYSYFRDFTIYCQECDCVFTVDSVLATEKEVCDAWNKRDNTIEKLTEDSKANFDKWKILADRTKERYAELYEEAKEVVRVQTIKAFAEKLKHKIINTQSVFLAQKGTYDFLSGNAHRQNEMLNYIDNLVKEMTESEEKENA